MKKLKLENNQSTASYIPFGKFVLRVPFLPFDRLTYDFQSVEKLLSLFSIPMVAEAIYIASPVLFSEIKKMQNDPEHVNTKDRKRIVNSFARYINRMSTRCTPFGMFAGCAVGNVGETTSVSLGKSIQRHARLDMDFLYKVYSDMVATQEMRSRIKYYPNTSIYSVGRKYRYIELRLVGVEREYHIVEIVKSKYVDKILKAAQSGKTMDSLYDVLTDGEVESADAREFVKTLIDEQVLIPELNQSIVGNDFLQRLISLCHKSGLQGGRFGLPDKMEKSIARINSSATFPLAEYDRVANLATSSGVPFDKSKLFQVDCSFDVSATIGSEVIEEINRTLSFLNRWQRRGSNPTLDKFKYDFANRYETQEVPLMEALDPDVGICYPSGIYSLNESPLLKNYASVSAQPTNLQFSAMEQWLFDKVMDAIHKGTYLILTDNDVKDMNEDWTGFHPSMSVMLELFRQGNEHCIHFISAGNSSAACLLSRFAHINTDLLNVVQSIADNEQESAADVCLAEIVHLPEGRIGNILARPDMRKYKILYMASPSDTDGEISMSDIMISVRNNKIHLHSKSDNHEIVPRLTSAHNYQLRTMPVYKFLCDMQDSHGIKFSWGALESLLQYRPRVMYGKTILAPASWNIAKKDYEKWNSLDSDNKLLSEIEKWRNNNGIPQHTFLSDGDNRLYIDWSNIISIRAFLSIVGKRPAIKLEEVLFTNDNLVVKGDDGMHTNEIIIPYFRKS